MGEVGEGRGEQQVNPKNKEGEASVTVKPSHSAVSHKTVELNKEISSLLVVSSQKDATIGNSSPPEHKPKRQGTHLNQF